MHPANLLHNPMMDGNLAELIYGEVDLPHKSAFSEFARSLGKNLDSWDGHFRSPFRARRFRCAARPALRPYSGVLKNTFNMLLTKSEQYPSMYLKDRQIFVNQICKRVSSGCVP